MTIITLCPSAPPPPPDHHHHQLQHCHHHYNPHHHHYCYHYVLWDPLLRTQTVSAEVTGWQPWFMLGHMRTGLLHTRSDK